MPQAVDESAPPPKGPDELRRENEALRDRLSRLSAAVLRISSNLDLDTVLHEVVESARALTGARYGVIATLDESRQVRDLVTSGLTPEERRRMEDRPDAPRVFERLRDLPGPLRPADGRGFARGLGFSSDVLPTGTLQGTPMRTGGAHVGNFFLADKANGQEFTNEDEEVPGLFASQAAAAVADARAYRREQRARADLEALVDTSPVGVAVFDARTGQPASSTARPGAWWNACSRRTARRRGCSGSSRAGAPTGARSPWRNSPWPSS